MCVSVSEIIVAFQKIVFYCKTTITTTKNKTQFSVAPHAHGDGGTDPTNRQLPACAPGWAVRDLLILVPANAESVARSLTGRQEGKWQKNKKLVLSKNQIIDGAQQFSPRNK